MLHTTSRVKTSFYLCQIYSFLRFSLDLSGVLLETLICFDVQSILELRPGRIRRSANRACTETQHGIEPSQTRLCGHQISHAKNTRGMLDQNAFKKFARVRVPFSNSDDERTHLSIFSKWSWRSIKSHMGVSYRWRIRSAVTKHWW